MSNCLKYLSVENIIEKEKTKYYRTIIPWNARTDRSRVITLRRYEELDEIQEYVDYKGCYMKYIAERLDDSNLHDCGKCANCIGKKYFSDTVSEKSVISAENFLKNKHYLIEPRKQYPDHKNIPVEMRLEKGYVLCDYGDSGWGKFIAEDKYHNGFVREEIINASVELIKKNFGDNLHNLQVTYIPSLKRPEFVRDFAYRIADLCNITCVDLIEKINAEHSQKELNNSYRQYENAENSYRCIETFISGDFLLIDDMVDSRWTLTVCGIKLKNIGAGKIYPFAIASSSEKKGTK